VKKKMVFKATLSAYVFLSGIWVTLAICYMSIGLKNKQLDWFSIGLLLCGITLAWWIWLWGFKITITELYLEYRNGLYKRHRIDLADIKAIQSGWIGWGGSKKSVTIQRVVIVPKNKKQPPIWINSKPFKRQDLRYLYNFLDNSKNKGENTISRSQWR